MRENVRAITGERRRLRTQKKKKRDRARENVLEIISAAAVYIIPKTKKITGVKIVGVAITHVLTQS